MRCLPSSPPSLPAGNRIREAQAVECRLKPAEGTRETAGLARPVVGQLLHRPARLRHPALDLGGELAQQVDRPPLPVGPGRNDLAKSEDHGLFADARVGVLDRLGERREDLLAGDTGDGCTGESPLSGVLHPDCVRNDGLVEVTERAAGCVAECAEELRMERAELLGQDTLGLAPLPHR